MGEWLWTYDDTFFSWSQKYLLSLLFFLKMFKPNRLITEAWSPPPHLFCTLRPQHIGTQGVQLGVNIILFQGLENRKDWVRFPEQDTERLLEIRRNAPQPASSAMSRWKWDGKDRYIYFSVNLLSLSQTKRIRSRRTALSLSTFRAILHLRHQQEWLCLMLHSLERKKREGMFSWAQFSMPHTQGQAKWPEVINVTAFKDCCIITTLTARVLKLLFSPKGFTRSRKDWARQESGQ